MVVRDRHLIWVVQRGGETEERGEVGFGSDAVEALLDVPLAFGQVAGGTKQGSMESDRR